MLFPTLLCRSCNFCYPQFYLPKRLPLKINFSNVLTHPIYQRLTQCWKLKQPCNFILYVILISLLRPKNPLVNLDMTTTWNARDEQQI